MKIYTFKYDEAIPAAKSWDQVGDVQSGLWLMRRSTRDTGIAGVVLGAC